MECTAPALEVQVAEEGCVIGLASLYADLARLPDKRHARGLRHALVTVLVYIELAKWAGQARVYGISQWAKHRQAALAEAVGLSRVRAPSVSTIAACWRRPLIWKNLSGWSATSLGRCRARATAW